MIASGFSTRILVLHRGSSCENKQTDSNIVGTVLTTKHFRSANGETSKVLQKRQIQLLSLLFLTHHLKRETLYLPSTIEDADFGQALLADC